MKMLGSREVQNKFGEVSNMVLRGDDIVVTQYGKPTLAIVRYEVWEDAMRLYKAAKMKQYMEALETSEAAESLSLDDINQLVHELRP